MAVKEPLVIRRVTSGALEYTANVESLEIKQIAVAGPSALTDEITVEIQDTTMLVVPAILFPYTLIDSNAGIFNYVRKKYPEFPTLKVLDGQKLTITSSGTFSALEVRYKSMDPADIKPEDHGTNKSDVRPVISTFYNTQSISATGWYNIDGVYGSPSIGEYPFLERVPSDRMLEIYGFAVYNPKNGNTKVDLVQLWKEETILFTPAKDGILVDPDVGNSVGNITTVSLASGSIGELKFMLFDTPLTLQPQDKLTLKFHVTYDGSNALPSKGFLFTVIGTIKPAK